MAYTERPPMLTGQTKRDLEALRDYLFRMAQSLGDVERAGAATGGASVSVAHRSDGTQVLRPGGGEVSGEDIEAVRRNAQELKALIIKNAKNLQKQIDGIEYSTFYIKYADDFAGDYPATMYNTPTENTYYMGVCSSTSATAPTNPSAYSWSRIKGDGGTGLNSATVFLYRRAESSPQRPQTDLTYTFASGRLNLGPAGVTDWTQEIPDSDGHPCWAITAMAIATTATDVIAATEWSEAKKLVEDGERGAAGQDGSDGTNGYNTAIVYLYKRAASVPSVDWQNTVTYSFTNKALASVPSGWSATVPSGDNPLYVTAATASSRDDTDTIAANEWATPALLAKNGEQGAPGPQGPDGRTSYLHIKYSDDGETFTDNYGEDVGAWIGMYTDYTETDSRTFSDYVWHRFADDEELLGVIETSVGELQREIAYNYVARSEFGTYTQNVTTQISETARSIVESYEYAEQIEAVNRTATEVGDVLNRYITSINGEIRRGYLTEPGTGDTIFGIAISSQLSFTGVTRTVDGEVYHELTSGQTLGLYTSTGWQFWAGGVRIGWFSSLDGMLHVPRAVIEDALQVGSDWQITGTGGFGLRYIGA